MGKQSKERTEQESLADKRSEKANVSSISEFSATFDSLGFIKTLIWVIDRSLRVDNANVIALSSKFPEVGQKPERMYYARTHRHYAKHVVPSYHTNHLLTVWLTHWQPFHSLETPAFKLST